METDKVVKNTHPFTIETYGFDKEGLEEVKVRDLGHNWPVVYIINSEDRLYVGETSSAYDRFTQHLSNVSNEGMREIRIIFDGDYNKSATLDIEQSLIRMFAADGKYRLKNANRGLSPVHNYYQREMYQSKVFLIWERLSDFRMTRKSYWDIFNSDLFKYSPYVSLTRDQYNTYLGVLDDIVTKLSAGIRGQSLVEGCAGTGKTLVAFQIIYAIARAMAWRQDPTEDDSQESYDPDFISDELWQYQESVIGKLNRYLADHGSLKIAYIMPVSSARKSMNTALSAMEFTKTYCRVFSPSAFVKATNPKKGGSEPELYDVVLVDECHRTRIPKNIQDYRNFYGINDRLGLDRGSSELEWIIERSRYQVLFYDSRQTIRGADIPESTFKSLTKDAKGFKLHSQMRCRGGSSYVDYVTSILDGEDTSFREVENYDLRLFDDVSEMVDRINELDRQHGLCKTVAGFSWEWKTKNLTWGQIREENVHDIIIGETGLVWNHNREGWVFGETKSDEVGSVHTVQGVDLTYVGVIFGEEIDYDPESRRIVIDCKKFKDSNAKKSTEYGQIQEYVVNSYRVMMTRGIYGCYVYACNENMRRYLEGFIKRDESWQGSVSDVTYR